MSLTPEEFQERLLFFEGIFQSVVVRELRSQLEAEKKRCAEISMIGSLLRESAFHWEDCAGRLMLENKRLTDGILAKLPQPPAPPRPWYKFW